MLVLHAEDDPKIPVSLAKALVQVVRQGGKGDILAMPTIRFYLVIFVISGYLFPGV